MQDSPYTILNSEDLIKAADNTALLGNSIVLNDNFDAPIPWERPIATSLMHVSIKLSSTMILFFCLSGEVTLRQGSREFTMRKNDVNFARSGILSEVTHFSRDVNFALVITDEKFYFPIFSGHDVADVQKTISASPVCSLPQEKMDECITLYKLLKSRLNAGGSGNLQKDIVRGYLQSLTFIVYSQYLSAAERVSKAEEQPVSRQQGIYNRFMELMQENYTHERKIAWYADKLCVTPRYLSRIIREISGHFAGEHIDLFVVAEAKHLLQGKKYTVLQVSEMLNFSSQSLFGRYFKNLTGYSPTDYQQLSSRA